MNIFPVDYNPVEIKVEHASTKKHFTHHINTTLFFKSLQKFFFTMKDKYFISQNHLYFTDNTPRTGAKDSKVEYLAMFVQNSEICEKLE